jgi:hypothetical protein
VRDDDGKISLGVPGHTYTKVQDGKGNWVAICEWHPLVIDGVDKDEDCGGFVGFDTPEAHEVTTPQSPKWQVECWDPLTLSPSLLCRSCGSHGFIREGKWVSA